MWAVDKVLNGQAVAGCDDLTSSAEVSGLVEVEGEKVLVVAEVECLAVLLSEEQVGDDVASLAVPGLGNVQLDALAMLNRGEVDLLGTAAEKASAVCDVAELVDVSCGVAAWAVDDHWLVSCVLCDQCVITLSCSEYATRGSVCQQKSVTSGKKH